MFLFSSIDNIFSGLKIIKNGNVKLNFFFLHLVPQKNHRKQLCLNEDPKLNLKIDHMVFYGGVLFVRLFTAQVMRNLGIPTAH